MADGIYDRGLDEMATFTSNAFKVLLLKGSGYTFSKSHNFISDLTVASNEIAGSGYSRQSFTSKTRTIDNTNHRIAYDAADPAFGSIVTGETASAMVTYHFVTNDSDSILVGYYDIPDTPTDGNPFTVILGSAGLLYNDQGA